jgi:hypothetical protein
MLPIWSTGPSATGSTHDGRNSGATEQKYESVSLSRGLHAANNPARGFGMENKERCSRSQIRQPVENAKAYGLRRD